MEGEGGPAVRGSGVSPRGGESQEAELTRAILYKYKDMSGSRPESYLFPFQAQIFYLEA